MDLRRSAHTRCVHRVGPAEAAEKTSFRRGRRPAGVVTAAPMRRVTTAGTLGMGASRFAGAAARTTMRGRAGSRAGVGQTFLRALSTSHNPEIKVGHMESMEGTHVD